MRVVQEVNGNHPGDKEEEEEEMEEEKKEEVEEPVKPPRLKKLARQQSKQELLRAKGFGQVILLFNSSRIQLSKFIFDPSNPFLCPIH